MKNNIKLLKYLLLIILVVGFAVMGYKTVGNKFFNSNRLAANDALTLNDKINSIPSLNTTSERVKLLSEIDDFVKGSVSGKSFSPRIYSLIKTRLDKVLKEVPETKVSKGKVKIWYIYNMGVIAKSEDKTIAFDLAGTYVYPNMSDFTKYIDVLFITHFHNDHFDKDVVQAALKNGVTIVIPDEKVRLEGDQLLKDSNGKGILDYLSGNGSINFNNLFIAIKPLEKTIIKGVEVTAYPSNHTGPDSGIAPYPLDWYDINLSGVILLHTGDGTSFNYQPDFANKNIDVFITHSTNLDSREKDNLIKLVSNAKTILPLHVLELGHGPDAMDNMNYQNILDSYSNGYYKTSQGKTKFIPMIWGESISF
jgi:hypothetical protein